MSFAVRDSIIALARQPYLSRTNTGPCVADLVNLNRVRKQKARAEKDREAAASRARFGRSKLDRALTEKSDARAAATLDAHRLDRDRGEKS